VHYWPRLVKYLGREVDLLLELWCFALLLALDDLFLHTFVLYLTSCLVGWQCEKLHFKPSQFHLFSSILCEMLDLLVLDEIDHNWAWLCPLVGKDLLKRTYRAVERIPHCRTTLLPLRLIVGEADGGVCSRLTGIGAPALVFL